LSSNITRMTGESSESSDVFPEDLILNLSRAEMLRYGENPHQRAAVYLDPNSSRPGAARARKIQGKELSYNNLLDCDAAFECVAEFAENAVVIVKHTNPCGVALAATPKDAFQKALACDPVSAFGGIVALNRTLDADIARELINIFLEVIIAPGADEPSIEILSEKPNVRVLLTGGMPDPGAPRMLLRSIAGGVLAQTADYVVLEAEPHVMTKRAPTAQEMNDMKFAFTVAKHVKSNTIVYAKNGATLGIGAGQMSRIYSAKIAAIKAADAKLSLKDAILASDAFMPFPDVVEEAARVGATAIIQPGGSLKDRDSIEAADTANIAMVFTGIRHFRH